MPKQVLTARIDEDQMETLEALAKERGLNMGQLLRGFINSQLAESDVDVALSTLYQIRESLDKRIASKEAQRIAELNSQSAPDLVTATASGVQFKIERAKAKKAGFTYNG